MLRKIHLEGRLKKLHEGDLQLSVNSIAEAIRALCYQIDGFEKEIKRGFYKIYLGEKNEKNTLDEGMLTFKLGKTTDIYIEPVYTGAKGGGGGVGKVIAGIAMVGLAIATSGASMTFMGGQLAVAGAGVNVAAGTVISSALVGKIGVALVLGGVSQLLAPQVKSQGAQQFERPEQKPSYLFNGPVNTAEQGGPVPLVYGRVRVGSTIVSSGLSTEKL